MLEPYGWSSGNFPGLGTLMQSQEEAQERSTGLA